MTQRSKPPPTSPPTSIVLYNSLLAAIAAREPMATICRAYACYVLACHAGNKSKAAACLQVHRRTLHRWVKERDKGLLPI